MCSRCIGILEEVHTLFSVILFGFRRDHVLETHKEYIRRGPHSLFVVLFDLLYNKIMCSRRKGNILEEVHTLYLLSYLASIDQDHVLEMHRKYIGRGPHFFSVV
jgi:hypothetical protein